MSINKGSKQTQQSYDLYINLKLKVVKTNKYKYIKYF